MKGNLKKRKIYLSTFSDNATEVIRRYKIGMEYNEFCISTNLDNERIDDTIDNMRDEMHAAGIESIEKCFVHGPFTEIYPQAIDPKIVEIGFIRLEQAYEGCKRLGAKHMVVHSGHLPIIYFPEWHIARSVEFWKRYMETKPETFNIYIENVLDDEPESMTEIVEKIGDKRVKLCLDVGHANVAQKSEYEVTDWIKIMGRHIGHLHIHNNNGKKDLHSPIEEGILNIEEILCTVDKYCEDKATLTVESRDCESSIKWLVDKVGMYTK